MNKEWPTWLVVRMAGYGSDVTTVNIPMLLFREDDMNGAA